jgi:hypothetical protein
VAGVAVCVHAILFFTGITLRGILPDSFAAQVHAQLAEIGRQEGRLIVVGAPAHATRLRVELDGRFEVIWAGDTALPREVQPSDVVVFDEQIADPSQLTGCRTEFVTCGYREYPARDLLAALLSGRVHDFLSDRQKRYVVATPVLTEDADRDIRQVGFEQP